MLARSRTLPFSVLERLSSSELVPLIQQQANFFGASASFYEPWPPVDAMHTAWNALNHFGLRWWAILAGTSLGFRLSTFELQKRVLLLGRERRAKLAEFAPARAAVAESLMRGERDLAKSQFLEYSEILKSRGLSGITRENKILLGLNAVWFLTFSASLRALVMYPDTLPSFCLDSGLLWIPSLALPDPLSVLPVVSSIAYLASMEAREEFQAHPQRDKIKWILRGVTFAALPVVTHLPAGFYIFMTCNAAFTGWFGRYMQKIK